MLTIQIKNGDNKTIAVINNIFSVQIDDEVNKGGKMKLKFPTEKRLQEKSISKGYKIVINYGVKIGKIIQLFDGYITDITLKTDNVEIQAENWLSYLQNRILRAKKTYNNQEIKAVISDVYSTLNSNYTLPISLGLNDCTTKMTKEFDIGTSFYDILKECRNTENELIVRVINGEIEASKNTGDILEGIWEYDVRKTGATNIVDWDWKDSMDNFYSYIKTQNGDIVDNDFNTETGLIFEKYDEKGDLVLPSGKPIPNVSISRDTDWRDFNIGDRKHIRLYTGYERLVIEYLGIIQSRKITINASGIKADIKVSEEYKYETNILDLILTNLREKK